MVAGGQSGSNTLDLVEMINLETMTSCVVNVKLDVPRRLHTGDGDLVCGGSDDDWNIHSSCYNIVTGTTISLNNGRHSHTSWTTGDGTYLVGGFDGSSYKTTELITGSTTQAGFTLKYVTL